MAGEEGTWARSFWGGFTPSEGALKSGSLEPPLTLTYFLGVFRPCRAPSSFPFAPRAHSSPPSSLFPCFDLFQCLAKKPGRAEACFQSCVPVRPGTTTTFPLETEGWEWRWRRWVKPPVSTLFFLPMSLCYLIFSVLFLSWFSFASFLS